MRFAIIGFSQTGKSSLFRILRDPRIWIGGVIGFAILFVVGTLMKEYGVVNQKFDEYSEALVGEKYEQAFELCSGEFRKATPFESYINQQKELHRRYGRLQSVIRESTEVSVNSTHDYLASIITAAFHFERGVTRIKYEFHYRNGKWEIFGYKENPN